MTVEQQKKAGERKALGKSRVQKGPEASSQDTSSVRSRSATSDPRLRPTPTTKANPPWG